MLFCFQRSCGAADDQPGLDDLVLHAALKLPFILVNGRIGCGFAYIVSPLFHGGELRVTASCTYAVCKSANGHVFGNTESLSLAGIEYSQCRVIVDGEETVGAVLQCQQFGGETLCLFPVVTLPDNLRINGQFVFQQGILVSVETVLGDLQVHGRTEEADAAASRLDQVLGGSKGSGIVIHHHSAGAYLRADAVEEYEGDAVFQHFMEMFVLGGVFGL